VNRCEAGCGSSQGLRGGHRRVVRQGQRGLSVLRRPAHGLWCASRFASGHTSVFVAPGAAARNTGVGLVAADGSSTAPPNRSVKRTSNGGRRLLASQRLVPPLAAAYLQRWACRNTVRAMQSAEHSPTVEHVNRFTGTVGVGHPSFGGRRTVGSHRCATAVGCSVRRAVLIGRNPSRGVVSARQVGALVRQASARFSPRPAQPCVQADGPKAAAA
jgi:hypothetical protein